MYRGSIEEPLTLASPVRDKPSTTTREYGEKPAILRWCGICLSATVESRCNLGSYGALTPFPRSGSSKRKGKRSMKRHLFETLDTRNVMVAFLVPAGVVREEKA